MFWKNTIYLINMRNKIMVIFVYLYFMYTEIMYKI